MKLKCLRNWITYEDGELGFYFRKDLSIYLTIGKIYYLANEPACSEWVYNIIDDRGKPHDMGKDMFIDVLPIEREDKLEQLGI
jgi:hypothetical protein